MQTDGKPVSPERADREAEAEAHQAILRALHSIRFGSLEVTVHDSRVVQIERREKIRFTDDARMNAGRRQR